MRYRIFVNDEPAGQTDWLPMAQAAWNRAVVQLGAEVTLIIDGQLVHTVTPRKGGVYPWPVADDHVTDLRDVAKAVSSLAWVAGVREVELAEGITALGLPTSRGRLKRISTTQENLMVSTTPAEIVALCYGAIEIIKARK